MTISETKRNLRTEVRAVERQLSPDERAQSDKEIISNVLNLPEYQNARCVFCFVGTIREVDTTAILLNAFSQRKILCVPLCTGKGIMELHQISALNQLHRGTYGILEPDPDTPCVDLSSVELSIIPCVSCDYKGHRLGQGGGYYDRFFSGGTERTVMLCRECLIRERIPCETHDLVFPAVVTELGVYRNGVLDRYCINSINDRNGPRKGNDELC